MTGPSKAPARVSASLMTRTSPPERATSRMTARWSRLDRPPVHLRATPPMAGRRGGSNDKTAPPLMTKRLAVAVKPPQLALFVQTLAKLAGTAQPLHAAREEPNDRVGLRGGFRAGAVDGGVVEGHDPPCPRLTAHPHRRNGGRFLCQQGALQPWERP